MLAAKLAGSRYFVSEQLHFQSRNRVCHTLLAIVFLTWCAQCDNEYSYTRHMSLRSPHLRRCMKMQTKLSNWKLCCVSCSSGFFCLFLQMSVISSADS